MEYKETMSDLSASERVTLAAQLTQAAMSIVSYKEAVPLATQGKGACQLATMIFGEMLRFVNSGKEPPELGQANPQELKRWLLN